MSILVALGVSRQDREDRVTVELDPIDERRHTPEPSELWNESYYLDWFNENVLARGSRLLGTGFWKVGDQFLIDTVAVNGSANSVGFIAGIIRRVQSGFLYSYAFWMVIGLAVMLGWFLTRLI